MKVKLNKPVSFNSKGFYKLGSEGVKGGDRKAPLTRLRSVLQRYAQPATVWFCLFQRAFRSPSGLLRSPHFSNSIHMLVRRGLCGRPLHPFAASLRMKGFAYESKSKSTSFIHLEGVLQVGLRRVPRGDRKAPWKYRCRKAACPFIFSCPKGLKGARAFDPFKPP